MEKNLSPDRKPWCSATILEAQLLKTTCSNNPDNETLFLQIDAVTLHLPLPHVLLFSRRLPGKLLLFLETYNK